MNEADLRASLAYLPLHGLRYFASTGSTNLDALAWAEAGAADGSLVVADEQTQGRGRLERRWVTLPGSGLAFSLILRPHLTELPHAALISPLGALAVCEALLGLGLHARIKWPNDVLVSGRKLCGILAESAWLADQLQAVVLGIGINMAPGSLPPTDQLNFPATCLEAELGREVDRVEFLGTVLQELFSWRPQLGKPLFFKTWQDNLAYRNEIVRVEIPGGVDLIGHLRGINADGSLRLIAPDGQEISVLAGDVRLRPLV